MDPELARKINAGSHGAHWGDIAERDFIRGIGEWADRSHRSDKPKAVWLQLYIDAHQKSPWPHHKAGVIFARKLLAQK